MNGSDTEISLAGGEFGKGHIVASWLSTPDLWFFDCHVVADPVRPGCLGLDRLGRWLVLARCQARRARAPRAIGVGEVKVPRAHHAYI